MSQSFNFFALTVNEGLSQNAVLSIAQDDDGFMWLGTQDGLNRYDAKSFKVYKHNTAVAHSISSNYICVLFVDQGHNLWVGTRNGLNRYRVDKDDFEQVPLAGPAGFPKTTSGQGSDKGLIISSIYQDQFHQIWVWTSGGLFLLHKKATGGYQSRQIPLAKEIAGLGGTNARTLVQMTNGDFYLGSSAGLTRMRYTAAGLQALPLSPAPGQGSHGPLSGALKDNYITCIFQDSKERIWVGTLHDGVYVRDSVNGTFRKYVYNSPKLLEMHRTIRTIKERADGKILVGTLGGLCVLDPAIGSCHIYAHAPLDSHSLSNNSIYSIYQAKDGIIWIGTYWGGVNYTSPYTSAFQIYKTNKLSGINSNVVSAIKEDAAHNLWMGTEGAGLTYMNTETGQTVSYSNDPKEPGSLASDLIKVIYIDPQGTVWVGTHGGGLNKFEKDHFVHYLYGQRDPNTLNAEILSLYKDPQERLWVGTQLGLEVLAHKDGQLLQRQNAIATAIGKVAIKTLMTTNGGQMLLIGTSNGLYITDGNQQIRAHLDKTTGLPGTDINCIYEDALHQYWVGFYNAGFCQLEIQDLQSPGHKPRVAVKAIYSTTDGLSDNNVLSIISDNNQKIWIGTGNGLSKFDSEKKVFSNYYVKDGIAGNTFNINAVAITGKGELLFGGYNGITRFFPHNIVHNSFAPTTILTGLSILNKPVTITGLSKKAQVNGQGNTKDPNTGILQHIISRQAALIFKADQNTFSVDFATLNYSMPEKNRYAYQLVGYNNDWVYTNTPVASFMNLPAGSYTLQVKGTNNDQLWGPVTSIKIKVRPHLYATVWAYLFYASAFFTLLFFIIRYFFMQSLLKKDQELTTLKLNFFTNISHEIRTHLTLVNGPVDNLMHTVKGEAEIQQLKTIKKNADSLLDLVTELMDFRKAETGSLNLHLKSHDLISFLNEEIMESFRNLSLSKNIRLDLISAESSLFVNFDKEQLQKVFFNLLHNAFKFTEPGCYIEVQVKEEKDLVQVAIIDNGSGISAENIDNIFNNYYQGTDNGYSNTGYGIGLALAKRIVELHGGTIAVESAPGKTNPTEGYKNKESRQTTFTVTLIKAQEQTQAHTLITVSVPDQDQDQQPMQGSQGNRSSESSTSANDVLQAPLHAPLNTHPWDLKSSASVEIAPAATILVVEDNDELRRFIRESLQTHYTVQEAGNGQQGLDMALALIPDIIISDIMMPMMDGIELTSRLKNNAGTNHIPVIQLTAKSTTGDYIAGLKTGADIYITKPFNTQVLQLHIHNLLELRKKTWEKFRLGISRLPSLPALQDQPTKKATTSLTASPKDKAAPPQKTIQLPFFVDDGFLSGLIAFIEDKLDSPELSVPYLAKKAAMSQPVLYKKVYALTEMTVGDLIIVIRLRKAAKLLLAGEHNVSETAYLTGFSDRRYFTKSFKKLYGLLPSEVISAKDI